MTVCALGHPLMEDEYLQTVERHKEGGKGKRGIDTMVKMFANLIHITTETDKDHLGDLFQGSITYGEKGQFLTPEPLCDLTATMTLPLEKTDIEGRRVVADECCGSGRMLLSASKVQPNWKFVGKDIDLRCVRMTAVNLAMRNLYGHVVCGDSLRMTTGVIYETGRVQVWGNAVRKVGRVHLPNKEPEVLQPSMPNQIEAARLVLQEDEPEDADNIPSPADSQLKLF